MGVRIHYKEIEDTSEIYCIGGGSSKNKFYIRPIQEEFKKVKKLRKFTISSSCFGTLSSL